jgi:hypothetical protein
MNKINLNLNPRNISIIILIIVTLIFVYPVYFVNLKIRNYKADVLIDYKKLAELESEKKILETYNKISSKDYDESEKIKKYVLSSDRKEVLGLINQLEIYTKKVGLTENNDSPIVSVASRENAELTKYNASDLVINIKVSGSENNINNFINILNNLPYVSYIEKIDIRYDNVNNKNSATMVLVIYQRK